MKNSFFYKFLIIFLLNSFFLSFAKSQEQFNFDVTEIEIYNKGNLYKGLKRGTIKTNDGIVIEANTFTYNKITNIVDAEGQVKVEDVVNNYVIFSDFAKYKKNEEIILTEGNSKGIDDKNRTITSDKLTYNKITNIVDAEGQVKVEDKSKNHIIETKKLTYFRSIDKIITKGFTEAYIENEYEIQSDDVKYLLDKNELSSKLKTTIKDNNNQIYYLDEFIYHVDTNLLKGKNVLTITNYNLPKSDKFYFLNGIFNLKTKTYTASDTKINIHKNIFDEEKNDPRIYGASSKGEENLTIIDKGIFTTCQYREGCPPWSIKSKRISHDRNKKQIEYKNAFLNVYDIPVFYFPKFFHPDPTVHRQSGFLRPLINKSNVLGSSLTQPYFKIISDNQDYTFSPTWFDKDIVSLQNEYRQANENSNFLADFGFVNGYKNNNRSHLFVNYDLDLKLEEFEKSNLFVSVEQVSNDTYLGVFNTHITKSAARPNSFSVLNNKVKLSLDHENYNFTSGFDAYENLKTSKNSDRYQYVLPHYSFDTVLGEKFLEGSLSFESSGSNNLNNTNELQSNIRNNIKYSSAGYINKFGLRNEYNLLLKNNNFLGKKSTYKSSPQVELESLIEINSILPLINKQANYYNYLTPKVSFKFNPTGMRDNSTKSRTIGVSDIFSTNRLGIGTFEEGKSLTIGLEYLKEKIYSNNDREEDEENIDNINKYFEVKLATVLRDKEERFIPHKSTLHRKNSNIFGSITNNLHDNIEIGYNFALDNDLNTFEYNTISTKLLFGDFTSTFHFLEENGEMGDANVLSSEFSYSFDENNFLTFKTRRNRKINLTEYYDLVYEYKNDCLTAGIKYKKTYYQDRDIKPNEDLLFTITLFPLTTYEHDAEDLVN